MKTSKIIPNRTCISVFLHTVLHCFHWEHLQVEGVRSAHGGSLRYQEIGQIQNWYVILKGENLGFHFNINLSATLENFSNYTQPYMHICFSTHCIALFPLRTPASWRSAKCTRRIFKVSINWPNSKLICYSERGEPKLSFEYQFVGHTWKLLKLYPTVHAYLFFYTLYCYCFHWEHGQVEGGRSAHGGSLRYEEIGQIQNWYVILKGENLSFHLNINLSATLENF